MENCSRCGCSSENLEELHPDYGEAKVCSDCFKVLVRRMEENRKKHNDLRHKADVKIARKFLKDYINDTAILGGIVAFIVFVALFILLLVRAYEH